MSQHPVLKELIKRGKLNSTEMNDLMKRHGLDPRGLGGFVSYSKLQWNLKDECWEPGPAIYESEEQKEK